MDTTSSSRFPITDTATLYQSHHYYHRSMSNCALRSFSQEEDDSISSATSTTRGRRRFRRVKTTERINPTQPTSQQQQQLQYQQTNESSHQLNTEFISTGLYEVSIRIKEDSSRPPNTSISDRCEFLRPLNDTTTNNKDDYDDESSISSMSSYGDATSSIIHNNDNNNNTDNNKESDALQIDETTATDISSDEKNDKK